MFFHKKISFFSDSGEFSFFSLFDSIRFSIDFGDSPKDGGKIASSKMLNLMKLIHAFEILLGLFLLFRDFGTLNLMVRPVLFLALLATIVN